MNSTKVVRVLVMLAIAIAVASAGLLGGAAPALAKSKAKPRVYTLYVDSRGGVLYYHRVRSCTKELDGVHVKKVRATLASIRRAGYRPCPKCRPTGYTKPPKRLYASKYSRYYSQNRRARFITAHRRGRLTLTWKQVVRRKLIPDPKTKPYGWVGFRAYTQAEPPSFIADALAEINRERAALGNPPVSLSATRSVACESWARRLLALRGVTGHDTMHTMGMDWSEPQSVGAGHESVGYGHEPHLNLLNGELLGGESWEHCPPLVDDPTIAYVGAAMVYKRMSVGWDGYVAECSMLTAADAAYQCGCLGRA